MSLTVFLTLVQCAPRDRWGKKIDRLSSIVAEIRLSSNWASFPAKSRAKKFDGLPRGS
jgi:hypothetical protein